MWYTDGYIAYGKVLMIKLNDDQQKLMKEWQLFLDDPDRQFFVLSGQAGTGKTTCVKHFLRQIQYDYKIAVTTPTNKSLKVIRDAVSDVKATFKTIYSLLNLRLEPSGEVKELREVDGAEDASAYDIIWIDEGSMLATNVLKILEKKLAFTNTKVIILGDKEQLPPVKEIVSPIWTRYPISFELTKVERHDNSILTFVQSIRANPDPEFISPGDEVYIMEEDEFEEKIIAAAKEGLFHDGTAKAIAWRNATVDVLNEIIRSNYHLTATSKPWVKHDRVVMMSPIPSDFPNAPSLANTDDEAVVLNVTVDRHPKFPTFKIWKLDLEMDDGDTIVCRVIHPDSEDDLKEQLDELAKKKNWHSFWTLKDAFHNIKHGYAFTAHRSQGSTIKRVFVDAGDIMMNRDEDTRTKCLYVGCSRASVELNIYP